MFVECKVLNKEGKVIGLDVSHNGKLYYVEKKESVHSVIR